jgi:hypothetical protein
MTAMEILTKAKEAALAGLNAVARAWLSEYEALRPNERNALTEAAAEFVRGLLPHFPMAERAG